MRLYLSSYKFGNHTSELSKLVGTNKRAAVIMNAVDWGDPVRTAKSLQDQISVLNSLGFQADGLDLRDYFGRREELAERMANYGLVWVYGGNSFVLKRAYEQSGFDEVIRKMLFEDKIVYGAFSAGVVVITPTLKGAEIVDDPSIIPNGYKPEFSLSGLGIIDYAVAVHFKSDHPESEAVDRYVEYCKKERIPCKPLRDGEVIVVDGDTERLFSIN